MLTTLVLVIHVIVCIALIFIILLQTGKGADIGAVFGGGASQTLFGSTGATPFLSKVTIGAAVIFMCTSVILTYFSGRVTTVAERSVVSEHESKEAPMPASHPSGAPPVPAGTEGRGSSDTAPVAPATSAPASGSAPTESVPVGAPSGTSGAQGPAGDTPSGK